MKEKEITIQLIKNESTEGEREEKMMKSINFNKFEVINT